MTWVAVILIIIIIVILLAVIFAIKQELNKVETNDKDIEKYPYKKILLLTKNEWIFYKKLKPICDKHNLHILSKIRLADLVEVDTTVDKKDKIKYLNKISRKHIDFALAKPENLQIVALIELDDRTHEQANRVERDNFINNVCKKTGYKIIHIRNYEEIEKVFIQEEIIKTENV